MPPLPDFIARIFKRHPETNTQRLDLSPIKNEEADRAQRPNLTLTAECPEHLLWAAKDSFMTYHRRAVTLGEDRGDHELLALLGEIRQDLVDAFELARHRIINEVTDIGYNPLIITQKKNL